MVANLALTAAAPPTPEVETTISTRIATEEKDVTALEPIIPSNDEKTTSAEVGTWLPELYIDRLLAQARTPENMKDRRPFAVKVFSFNLTPSEL